MRSTTFRLTEDERETVDRAAEAVGCESRSEFVRRVVLAVAERIRRGEPEEREGVPVH